MVQHFNGQISNAEALIYEILAKTAATLTALNHARWTKAADGGVAVVDPQPCGLPFGQFGVGRSQLALGAHLSAATLQDLAAILAAELGNPPEWQAVKLAPAKADPQIFALRQPDWSAARG